ncbi:MAG: 4-hydroxy-tetrahydrodipicolinate synthase [Firmicutes bacterium]|jgi:4-hydroxy-tetrahydrodipicolinate synthase|uniref:4-hydroxy-tetrahydrodipicolinate synthase n=1 Tax=Sulfobacillus benefaciens TaxID=453960 RepID=A0A2T2X853_9FIRM|nr:4-hydroxy-tetrahydrodipicolinate synthase [Bacillota bacterium]MCL5012505.1 4-hydroxy-tetrahydrodipicolinate synthase [Bacillota bacterium]PSR30637.1 MAG: 4-hydroxy-tetrahydrodipicolinate synthase [Sulfobacillus benefaciens]
MQLPRIFTAMVTPFNESGEMDYDQAGRLAEWLMAHGSEGLILSGTTGESPALTDSERMRLLRAVRERLGPDVPLWMGTGTNNTVHSRELSWEAADNGADGVLLVCPYYNKPPQEGLIRHFTQIATGLPIPVMLYNIPSRTGVNLLPASVRTITQECDNVVAIKEAGGSLPQLQELIGVLPPRVRVYSGDDAMYFTALTLGAYGVVSVAAHLVGNELGTMTQSVLEGNLERARRIHATLTPLFQELFRYTNPISVKWALNYLGIPVGDVRLPLVTPHHEQAFESLRQLIIRLVSAGLYSEAEA